MGETCTYRDPNASSPSSTPASQPIGKPTPTTSINLNDVFYEIKKPQ